MQFPGALVQHEAGSRVREGLEAGPEARCSSCEPLRGSTHPSAIERVQVQDSVPASPSRNERSTNGSCRLVRPPHAAKSRSGRGYCSYAALPSETLIG